MILVTRLSESLSKTGLNFFSLNIMSILCFPSNCSLSEFLTLDFQLITVHQMGLKNRCCDHSWIVIKFDLTRAFAHPWIIRLLFICRMVWQNRVGFLHVEAKISQWIVFHLIGQRRRQAMPVNNQNSWQQNHRQIQRQRHTQRQIQTQRQWIFFHLFGQRRRRAMPVNNQNSWPEYKVNGWRYCSGIVV